MAVSIEGMDRIAVYLRKSRADQEAEARGEGETLSKHRKALFEYATKHKILIQDENVYQEVVSGEKIAYRPEMQRLLENVELGKYKAVLCMDVDRLGRGNMIDQGTIQEAFKLSNTLIITPRKVYDLNDELDEEWSEFESFMARRELKIITRRMQRGRVQSVLEGKYIGAKPPFGYNKNSDSILVPNDDAKIVKMIFDWYVDGDEEGNPMGSTKIADRLNELGIKSPLRKQDWIPSTVLSVLKNEVYIGKIQWKKTFRDKKEGIGYRLDRSEWIEAEKRHEFIIDEAKFKKAQNILENNLTPQTKTKTPRNPLAGLIECGGCKHKMVMQTSTGKRYAHIPMEQRLRMVKCITPGCTVRSSSFKYIEERLLAALEDYLEDLILEEEKIKLHYKKIKEDNLYPKLILDAEKQLDGLQKQVDKIDTFLEQGVYSIEKYTERSQKLNQEILRVNKVLKELKEENSRYLNRTEGIPKRIDTVTRVIRGYVKAKVENDVTLQNKLLKQVLVRVIYHREQEIEKGDFDLNLEVKEL
ncbi:recombinase family protein [Desulfosporosinus sp. SYSU MS00001]|uniref:recombinase family protein n=1 Tax=Desulfosporosinus sp. SYSU MS00001 TaxID=3416284 RepID=UPI003CECE0CA